MHAILVGATGLIGGYLLQELLDDPYFAKVTALTRTRLKHTDPKLINIIINFDSAAEIEHSFYQADFIFLCVGTTQKKVKGDLNAYRKVDYDIPVNIAKSGLGKGGTRLMLVSSVGADASASNFYLKLKGEVENAINNLGYPSVYIARPSILLGERAETRVMEGLAKSVMGPASSLLFGNWKKYRAIHAKDVALALINGGKQGLPGIHVLQYDEIMQLSK